MTKKPFVKRTLFISLTRLLIFHTKILISSGSFHCHTTKKQNDNGMVRRNNALAYIWKPFLLLSPKEIDNFQYQYELQSQSHSIYILLRKWYRVLQLFTPPNILKLTLPDVSISIAFALRGLRPIVLLSSKDIIDRNLSYIYQVFPTDTNKT